MAYIGLVTRRTPGDVPAGAIGLREVQHDLDGIEADGEAVHVPRFLLVVERVRSAPVRESIVRWTVHRHSGVRSRAPHVPRDESNADRAEEQRQDGAIVASRGGDPIRLAARVVRQ